MGQYGRVWVSMVVLSNDEGKGHRLLRFKVTLLVSLVKILVERPDFVAEKAGRRGNSWKGKRSRLMPSQPGIYLIWELG